MNRTLAIALFLSIPALADAETTELPVRLSWGHTLGAQDREVSVSGRDGLQVRSVKPGGLERGDRIQNGAVRSRAGGGDVDSIDLVVAFPDREVERTRQVHVQWAELVAHHDADSARRFLRDPAYTPGAPALTVTLDAAGTTGFTVTVEQLKTERAIWIPSLDVYVTAGDTHVPFADHMRALEPRKGTRVLDRVRTEPEATYADYTARWEDMGSPDYVNPFQQGPGHIVGLTWDSAIHKFGVDRAAGVTNDDGNPDKFRFWFSFGDLSRGVSGRWKSQRLQDGLPVTTTTFEEDGVRYEVEQFAYPLQGPPAERRGDMPMVLLQRVTLTELAGKARTLPITMAHSRQLPEYFDRTIVAEREGQATLFRARGRRNVLLSIEGVDGDPAFGMTRETPARRTRFDATVFLDLPAKGTTRFVVKLPSPMVPADSASTLTGIDYDRARETTLKFWSDYVARGGQLRVPERVVNDVFNASLWHALRLPRRHGGAGPNVRIDLPYSNFAYSQVGTPWPVNHAVYVDYMIYDLRGYHAIAAEELEAQYRNTQEHDGHVSGYANWLVYTPSMLYAVAQNYLLSHDRAAFERLLPASIKAMDWCLARIERASAEEGPAKGLVRGPLNDNTGDGVWAFNQAYLFAGLDLFGRALERFGHPRAGEAKAAAAKMREAIARGFAAASVRSPIVQLRDGTWTPYVPAEALASGRLLHEWYPTDVDTGATHLLRLKALPPAGRLADALLHDHEDNLYFKGWGMAQEPIYNQQATAYLLRDDPEAVIRAFYSYLASAFSHSVLEPVEHRWGQGQFFGPPSTDGAWFELYRNMLVHERDEDVLALGLATPRAWLRDGETIVIDRMPTYYGRLTARIESKAAAGEIRAVIEMPANARPSALLVRLRHPDGARMRAVTVNGASWTDFDADAEWVRIPAPDAARYEIVARY